MESYRKDSWHVLTQHLATLADYQVLLSSLILERILGRKIMWLACGHHTSELVLKAVCIENFGKTTCFSNPIFKHFQTQWNSINQANYEILAINGDWLNLRKESVVQKINCLLKLNDKTTF